MTDGPPAAASAVVVRIATEDELDLAGEAVRSAYADDGLTPPGYLTVIADARDRARDACVAVAVDAEDQVVGSVTFVLPGSRWSELARDGEAEFRMLGVRPDRRGLGVGTALLEWCVDRARDLGREGLVICSAQAMSAAQRLYARRGFTRRPDLDWSPEPGILLLGFRLDLN